MNKTCLTAITAVLFLLCATVVSAQTVVYNSIPNPVPGNVPSEGFQCCANSEFGDQIKLAGTARAAGDVTVLMSSWAKKSDYPSMLSEGFTHPITLNIYADAATAKAHTPLITVTKELLMLWRPEADPSCGTAWFSAADNKCYNGKAFEIKFDLRTAGPGGTSVLLPDTLIFGIAYNTQTWGYNPLHQPGPYESLNVGLNNLSAPSVGTDINPNGVFMNTSYAPFYNSTGEVGVFREDATGWASYVPAIKMTAYAIPATINDCKGGGWQNLFRKDLTPFKNQGACVSYVDGGN